MFNLKSIVIAVTLTTSALVSLAPAAQARDKVIVIEQNHRGHDAREMRRDRHNARDHRAARRAEARRAEARRDRRHDRRSERRQDRRDRGPVIVLKAR
jgi:hypothetical protein